MRELTVQSTIGTSDLTNAMQTVFVTDYSVPFATRANDPLQYAQKQQLCYSEEGCKALIGLDQTQGKYEKYVFSKEYNLDSAEALKKYYPELSQECLK